MKRSGLSPLRLSATEADGAGLCCGDARGVQVSGAFDLSKDTKGVSTIAESDAILLGERGCASGKQLKTLLNR